MSFFEEAFEVYDVALVPTFADLLLFVVSFDYENQVTTIDLNQFCCSTYTLAKRGGRQVTHINPGTYRDVAWVYTLGDGLPGGLLHQGDHHGCAEDFDAACTDISGGVFVSNGGSRFSGQAWFKWHVGMISFLLDMLLYYTTKPLYIGLCRQLSKTICATSTRFM